jgi:hypothetical protein
MRAIHSSSFGKAFSLILCICGVSLGVAFL